MTLRTEHDQARPNKGALLLRAVLQARNMSQADADRLLGTWSGTVNRWLSGARRPIGRWPFLIEDKFGVPARSWSQEPNDGEPIEAIEG